MKGIRWQDGEHNQEDGIRHINSGKVEKLAREMLEKYKDIFEELDR